MRNRLALVAAAMVAPVIVAAPANAQYYDSRGGYGYGYDDRSYYEGNGRVPYGRSGYGDARTYRGRDVRYYQQCRRSSGTTGLLAGGAGGALIGSALGGNTLGTLLGAVGGGLLGRELDKRHDAEQNYRNGC